MLFVLFFSCSWSDNPTDDLKSYFLAISKFSYNVDPFWMVRAEASPVDRKKSLKLISGLEHTEKNLYEAVLNFNGQKEALVSQDQNNFFIQNWFKHAANWLIFGISNF